MPFYVNVLEPALAGTLARLPSILMALLALFIGWIVARLLGKLAAAVVYRLTHMGPVRDLVEQQHGYRIDRVVGRVVYYLLMVLVLVLFFDILGVTAVMDPFLAMTREISLAVPSLIKAVLILLGAWVLATLLRGLTLRLLAVGPVSQLIERTGVAEGTENQQQVVRTAGTLVYYLTLLLFLPAIMGALQLHGLLAPVEQVVAETLAFLPNLAAALLMAVIGYLVARIVRGLVTHFLGAVGADRLPERVGLDQVFKATPLSRAIGTIVFVLILIPVVISALESLGVAAISGPAIAMLTVVLEAVPAIAAGLLFLAAGIALARWIGQLTAGLVEHINLSRFLLKWGLLQKEQTEPPVHVLVGKVVAGIIGFLVLIQVLDLLRLQMLSSLMRDVLAYLPNVAVAVLILTVGFAVGQFAARSLGPLLEKTEYPNALGSIAKYAIFVFAAMMALEQLGVSRAIVVNAFTIVMGAFGLTTAIAVGLGAKDLVQRKLDQWLQNEKE